MGKLGTLTREEIRAALAGTAGATAKHVIADLAVRFGVSVGYLYRISAEARGGRADGGQRKARKDVGQRRVALTPDIEHFMEKLSLQDLSAAHIIFFTARHFGLPDHFISTTTYNNLLRAKRISRRDQTRDLRPYRNFEAAKANDLHHYDTTVAEAYYVNDDGSIGHEAGHVRYKNKPGNRRPRLILYSLVDDHSRVIFARFYIHESSINLLDFVLHAWSQKDDKRFPFYGIPTNFYADNGSPRKSGRFVKAMQVLGVNILDSTPAHRDAFGSRKHGKVERTFGEGLLGEFMKLTQFYRFASLEELNSTLWDWLIWTNNRAHTRTKHVRFQRWLTSVGTPRSMPNADLFKLLHYDHVQRVLSGNLQISLNGKTYQLPYQRPFINWVGVKVEVYAYPGHDEKIIVVHDHHEEEIRALAPVIDLALEYKQAPTTDREVLVQALQQTPLTRVNVPDLYKTALAYLPKKGEQFDDTKIAAKVVEQPDGSTRPSFAPMRWLTRMEVLRDVTPLFLREDGEIDRPARIAYADSLMQGRATITQDEFDAAVAPLRQQRTGTEG